jgi:hypothetical protein
LDAFPNSHFAAAVLVGVFSYGQVPAFALDEIVRVVKPGGVVVFTMRTDFHDSDAMGVRSRIEALVQNGAWQPSEVTQPEQYLPKLDPDAMFRVWCYRVLPTKLPDVPSNFAEAVRAAMTSRSKVKRIDHCHIWNSMASRLYNRYIECPGYYLVDCEEEILRTNADAIAGSEHVIVELGCGSARKVRNVLDAALRARPDTSLTYIPIDLPRLWSSMARACRSTRGKATSTTSCRPSPRTPPKRCSSSAARSATSRTWKTPCRTCARSAIG